MRIWFPAVPLLIASVLIAQTSATTPSTIQDKATYSKLQHDLQKLREKTATLSQNTSSPDFVALETQLLRLEARINTLRSVIWYKIHISPNPETLTFYTKKGVLYRPTSLPFVREMLRYRLNTDGLLTVGQRHLLHDKLKMVTIQLQKRQQSLSTYMQYLNKEYGNISDVPAKTVY